MNTFESLFDWFLSATVRGSLLALAVLLVRAALKNRLPAFWRHALWLPVFFVLGSPVLPESPWSLEGHWAAAPATFVSESKTPGEGALGGETAIPPIAAPDPIDWEQIAALLWLAGAAVTFFVGLAVSLRSVTAMRERSVSTDPPLLAEVGQAARICGLRRIPRLLLSTAVPGPAVTGLLHPLLLLPGDFTKVFDREERRLILLHECLHLKRGDLPINWLVFALQSLHWCNPLVWFAFACFRADRELACDSAVLAASDDDLRGIYGNALLKVESGAGAKDRRLGFVGLVGLFGRGNILRSRIAAIAGYRRPDRISAILGLTLLLTLVLVGATRAQIEAESAPGEQILIETKFIEVPADAVIEILSKEATFDQSIGAAIFSADAKAVEVLTKAPGADVLSAPTVVTLSGKKAIIETGREMPGEGGKPRTVGVRIELLPVLKGDTIELSLDARSTKEVPVSGSSVPAFSEQRLESTVLVHPGDTVILQPTDPDKGPVSPKRLILVVTARIPATAAAVQARLERIVIPQIEFRDVPLSEALAFLREKARELDPEKQRVNLVHLPTEGAPEPRLTLSLRDIPLTEALKYIAALSNLEVAFEDPAIVFRDPAPAAPQSSAATMPATVAVGKTHALAAGIILPRIDLEEAFLPDVLQLLQQQSLALDPEKNGLNFVLDAPGQPDPHSIQISLSLRDIPLSEALRYVAELANLKLRYDEDAVVFLRY